MGRPAGVPAYEPDLYATQAIVDPHPHYARLRRLGPVVWLTKQRVYALPRYAQCKAVLRDDTTFISGEGVGLNRMFNRLSRGTTLNSDGDEHDQRRKLVAHRLLPRALRTMSDVVTHQAEQLVAEAVRRPLRRSPRLWHPGRRGANSEIFLDDVTVSRRHAEFRCVSGEFQVVDVGSLNGTYVNREAVDWAVLANGDEVQIGKFRLVFLTRPTTGDTESVTS